VKSIKNRILIFGYQILKSTIGMHYRSYECLNSGHIQVFWTWCPEWLFGVDFLYPGFIDEKECERCILARSTVHCPSN